MIRLRLVVVVLVLTLAVLQPERAASETDAATAARLSPSAIGAFSSGDGRILADGRPIRVRGVNWAGHESTDRAPHGLWTGRTPREFLAQAADLGFDALRLPLSPDVLRPGLPVAEWAASAGFGPDGAAMLEQTLDAALDTRLWVLLAFHTPDSRVRGADAPKPYDDARGYDVEDWLDDLARMADIARRYPNVIGIDLFNEPHGVSWREWRDLAGRGGRRVLDTNPRLLVFVEGVGETGTDTAGHGAFWGANLVEARTAPIDPAHIPPDKLVFSPHVYGPDVYRMPYFTAADFPANMPAIWDAHFGHLAGDHTLCVGEFGGRAVPESLDGRWLEAFADYMNARRGMADCWFHWQLGPNSSDTGGVLADDWQTPVAHKLAVLRRLGSR